MKKTKAADVYARALWESAQAQGPDAGAAVSGDMRAIFEAFAKLPALGKFLSNPVAGSEKKSSLLKSVSGKFAPLTAKFLRLVESKNRLGLLDGVAREYLALEEIRGGVLRAVVTSASPLTPEQLEKIAQSLSAGKPGKKFLLTQIVDPSLIAGFRIQEGDVVTDASVRNKLDLMRQKLAA